MQLTHYTSKFERQKFPVTLVSDNVTNATNIGSLFRISDAFGVEKLVLCGENIPVGRKMTKTSRATEKVVDYEINPSTIEVAKKLKKEGYQIIALEITTNSKPIHEFSFSKEKPIALIVGDENFGVSEDVLKLSDYIIHIEMYGQNSSMNVVQATNIALYEITKQLR
ncbi:TrmH family RNA methyltransferase [Hyunsoonleella sp. SJ7]|uniref:TrmH family RNA methyltransferase n=1 Tax=Hyunsoonleella aquatilis TaxID=2762758 RepID=A0A923HFU6_9FLAO|nr:TrmH family RNA methyltransferase [Hyunsoonleella aquatilis]MBC3758610.1 TrmH family RNA methyltransferase [Hyunsoonleella aquatilis]